MKGLSDRAGLEAFVEFLKRSAAEYFMKAGQVLPHAFIIGTIDPSDGKPFAHGAVAIPCVPNQPPSDEFEYTHFIAGIRAKAIEVKAVGVVAIAEAWFAAIDPGTDPDTVPALNNSSFEGRRREAIVMTIDHLAFKATVRWAAIIHREPSVRLQSWQRMPRGAIMRERFSDAFPRELWQ